MQRPLAACLFSACLSTCASPQSASSLPPTPLCPPTVIYPEDARALLRSGPFSGLRDNIRAIGEYAVAGGAPDAQGLVASFFKELEALDLLFFQGAREQKLALIKRQGSSDEGSEDAAAPLPTLDEAEASAKLGATIAALDTLLATVPEDVTARAQALLDGVNAKRAAAQQAQQQQQAGGAGAPAASGGELDDLLMAIP